MKRHVCVGCWATQAPIGRIRVLDETGAPLYPTAKECGEAWLAQTKKKLDDFLASRQRSGG